MTDPLNRFYEFGDFRLDSLKRTLQKGEEFIPLKGKAFDLLLFLVESNGSILTHEQLLDEVWEGTFVEQANLKKNISTLRKVLDEQPDESNYIQTLPKKGYRFVAEVKISGNETHKSFDAVKNLSPNLDKLEISNEANINSFEISNPPRTITAQSSAKPNSKRFIQIGVPILVIALCLLGFWFWKSWQTSQFDSLKLEKVRLLKLPAISNVETSSISPDGKIVVYATIEEGEKQALWMKRIGTPNTLQLVAPSEMDYRAIVISPDSNYVYYGVTISNTIDYLYQIPILGGTPRKITEGIHSPISFSNDGKRIAFVRDDAKGRTLFTANAADGGDEREVFTTPDAHNLINPRFSPNGQNFALIMGEATPNGRLWSLAEMPAIGGKIKSITKPQKNKIFDFTWLTDGSGFVISAEPPDTKQTQLYRVSYPAGEFSKLTNDFLDYHDFNVSDDGKSVLALQKERVGNIWAADAGNLTSATKFNSIQNPFGKFTVLPTNQILYANVEGGQRGLSIADPDGNNSRSFKAESFSERDPAVSPDGKSVVFISKQSGIDEVWQSDLNGANIRQLTDEKTFIATPQMSPDGKSLYFQRFDDTSWHLIKLSLETKKSEIVFDDTISDFDFSPDGKSVAYSFYNNQKKKWNIGIRNLADNSVQKTFDVAAATFVKWTADGKGIIYNVSDVWREGGNVWLQPIDGTAPKLYLDAKPQKIYIADFSLDGSKLFYMRGVVTSSIVLIKTE